MSVASARVDISNMVLIVASAILAWLLPFQLFVASYVVLGPLHYLTEIGWLHGKSYFRQEHEVAPSSFWQKHVPWALVAIVLLLSIVMLRPYMPASIADALKPILPYQGALILGALFWSLTWIIRFTDHQRLILVATLVVSAGILTSWHWPAVYLALLPTLVHVFLFTGIFMVQGALARGTWVTWLSVLVLVLASLSFFVLPTIPTALLGNTGYWLDAWQHSGLLRVVGYLTDPSDNPMVIRWQAFVAFAYTYHYLNWFSKVDIIKWHKVPAQWLMVCAVAWVCSVALYVYDVAMGMRVLYSISMLHVVLEFPLNMLSMKSLLSYLPWSRKDTSPA